MMFKKKFSEKYCLSSENEALKVGSSTIGKFDLVKTTGFGADSAYDRKTDRSQRVFGVTSPDFTSWVAYRSTIMERSNF